MDAVAFQALVDAADGADNIAGYCKDATTGNADAHGQGQASPPSVPAPATSVSPPEQRPTCGPGPIRQHRPGRKRTGRTPNHHRLTHSVVAANPPSTVVQ